MSALSRRLAASIDAGLSMRRVGRPLLTREAAEAQTLPEANRRYRKCRRCDKHRWEHLEKKRAESISKVVTAVVSPHVKRELEIAARMLGITPSQHVAVILEAIVDANLAEPRP